MRFGSAPEAEDYQETCRRAGMLLHEPAVGRWTARRFPTVLVDELQDSKGGQLLMIQGLARNGQCLVAADHFQDLDADEANEAVVWACEQAEIVTLDQVHRTTSPGLLSAATALREGRSMPISGGGFKVLCAYNANQGASYVSQNLTWWKNCNDIAVISPVRPERSPFVRNLLERVQKAPIGKKSSGPHRVPWEVSQDVERAKFLDVLDLPNAPDAKVLASELELPSDFACSRHLSDWMEKQLRLAGRTIFTVAELHQQVALAYQRRRAYGQTRERGVRAMTVHQAKNREFHSVIVLWPYEVQGSPERLRRIL